LAAAAVYVGSGFSRTRPRKVRLKADPTYSETTYETIYGTRHTRVLLALAALPTAATLVYEWTTGDMPSNAIRALAGAMLGAAIAFIVLRALPNVN
jgi:hypothetical protein